MGCMSETMCLNPKLERTLHRHERKCDKSHSLETNRNYQNHTIQLQNDHPTCNNIRSDYIDDVGQFIVSNIIKLNNNLSSKSNLKSSCRYVVRHSLSLYAASSVILALCYLTTAVNAAAVNSTSNTTSKATEEEVWQYGTDKQILDFLLASSKYDKRLVPPSENEDFCCGMLSPDMARNLNISGKRRSQNNDTLTINVNVLLLSLASPDESSLKYEVEFLLNQQWYDSRLQYGNRSSYSFLNAIHHHEDIWLPDTYFIMHGDFKDPIIPMHFALRIYRNGTITYSMRRHLILSCQGSLAIFPFDDPQCSFAMESISYELDKIKYVWKNDEETLRRSPSLTTLNAYLVKNATINCPIKGSWRGNYSCLSVELTFTRDRAFYFTTVFIPGIILVTSSFITFWLEWNAVPARVMIGVTTMLNFFTTSNGFRSTLPVVSNLTAMNVWDGVCMCFIYASLLEFVCVNYVGRKRPLHNVVYRPGENPVTQRLPAVLSRIGIILASPLEIIEQEFMAALSTDKVTQPISQSTTTLSAITSQTTINSHVTTSSMALSSIDSGTATTTTLKTTSSVLATTATSSTPIMSPTTPSELTKTQISDVNDDDQLMAVNTISETIPTSSITQQQTDDHYKVSSSTQTPYIVTTWTEEHDEIEKCDKQNYPVKPPRRKISRTSGIEMEMKNDRTTTTISPIIQTNPEIVELGSFGDLGEKKRDTGANEIVACTNCGGGTSPCTHSANNGCATETCFVQVRKKEPPHPIRVAKTIDVIARITFPTAYAIFLIFFFIHYKGF